MSKVNTATKKAKAILGLLSECDYYLGLAPDDYMNHAIGALSAAVAKLVTDDGPLWEKVDADEGVDE